MTSSANTTTYSLPFGGEPVAHLGLKVHTPGGMVQYSLPFGGEPVAHYHPPHKGGDDIEVFIAFRR